MKILSFVLIIAAVLSLPLFSAGVGEVMSLRQDKNIIDVTPALDLPNENSEQAFLNSKAFSDIMRVLKTKNTTDFENDTADIQALWYSAYTIYKTGVIDTGYAGLESAAAELFKVGGAHEFFAKKTKSDIMAKLSSLLDTAYLESAGYEANVRACIAIKNTIKESSDFVDKKDEDIVFITTLASDRLDFLALDSERFSEAKEATVTEFLSAVNSFDKSDISGIKASFESLKNLYLCCEGASLSNEVISKYSDASAFAMQCSYSTYVFLNTVAMIEGKDEPMQYELLSACYLCYDYLDTKKSGVQDAINAYETYKSAYEASVENRNNEISQAHKVALMLRKTEGEGEI